MTTYTMTGPDGKDYSIDGPPGASEEDVRTQMQAAHANLGAVSQSGGADTAADSVARGLPSVADVTANPLQRAVGAANKFFGLPPLPDPRGSSEPKTTLRDIIDMPKGLAVGAYGGVAGVPGDIAALARTGLSKLGLADPSSGAYTTQDMQDSLAGAPTSEGDRAARAVGNLISPFAAGKLLQIPGKGAALAKTIAGGGEATDAAQSARASGFVIPPVEVSPKPSAVTTALSGIGGRVKLWQQASTANEAKVNALAAKAVGLPTDQPITESALEGVRSEAGKAYEAVRNAPVEIIPDAKYASNVADLHSVGAAARAEVPDLVGNPELQNLSESLANIKKLSPNAAVDLVKSLRYKAQTNLKNYTSPEKMDLGRAQSKAANAVETLIERNLEAATTARGPIGAQGGDMSAMVDNLQAARQIIAKTYNIQDALNQATGHIDATKFAKLAAKGKPLTDELAQIGQAASDFPKSFQNPAKFGHLEPVSKLDMAGAVLTHGMSLPLSLGGPYARKLLLSEPYQNLIAGSRIPNNITNASGVSVGANLLKGLTPQILSQLLLLQPQSAATP